MAQLHRAREEYSAAEGVHTGPQLNISAEEQTAARLRLAHVYSQDAADDKALEQLQAVLTVDSANTDAHGLIGELLVRHTTRI
jgi:predicted negative regulator of RcsB-dependent stress response